MSTVLEAACNGTPCLLVRGSGKAADLIADCVLARYSQDHELGQEASARDENQKLLMAFLTEQGGLRSGEGTNRHEDHEVDIIKKPGTDLHNLFNLAGVKQKLINVSKLKMDARDVEDLETELQSPNTPVLALKEWIDDYIQRASAMPRNFYGQTKKERKEFRFSAVLTPKQSQIISALCEREGEREGETERESEKEHEKVFYVVEKVEIVQFLFFFDLNKSFLFAFTIDI